MWIRVGGVKSGRLINFIVLPLGSAMVIDPMDLMCNHHLTPTRGGMETVNRNLNGARCWTLFLPISPQKPPRAMCPRRRCFVHIVIGWTVSAVVAVARCRSRL